MSDEPCKICGGEDGVMPCGFPSGCMRDQRRIAELEQRLAAAHQDFDRQQWLIENGERVFGTLWRQATWGDIDAAIGKPGLVPEEQSNQK